MPTLITDVGGSNSNSYLDLAAARALLSLVPNAGAFLDEQDDDKLIVALASAATLLESMAWQGTKTKNSTQQALAWPRAWVPDPDAGATASAYVGWTGLTIYLPMTEIPRRILRAQAMLALEIMRAGSADVWGVDASVNITSETVDVITTEYVEPSKRHHGLRNYPSVWREIFPLLLSATASSVERA